jgi:pSer/pThr/pTyr-binding forkhead associated (FHA) protein
VNGALILASELKHGDRFQLGEHVFQFVLEQRRRDPRTYVLPDE